MANNISLITPPTLSHRTAEETLALGYLASVLRSAGYNVTIIDTWLERLSPLEVIQRLDVVGGTDLVGVSCYRSNLDQAEEMIVKIRHHFGNVPVICGGYGPTFHDNDFLERGFTVAVRGEAEHVIVPLVKALLSNEVALESIPGISYYRDGQIVQTKTSTPTLFLDEINFPARDTVQAAINNRDYVHLCTSRGCGAYCIFCSIFAFALDGSPRNRWRQRSLVNVIDEIEMLYHEYGVRHFKFVDDSFIEQGRDEVWARNFRDEITRRNLKIRFRTQVRADTLTSGIVRYLAEAGWVSTSVGIENGSPTALKRMHKIATLEQNIVALQLLKENGVYVQMGYILFDPFTTMVELWDNVKFLEYEPWAVYKGIFTEMYAAKGTPLTRKLQRKKLLNTNAESQNFKYEVLDKQAQRMYVILKNWHKSHSEVFDWVIDSLTAPKVLPDKGYKRVHELCLKLRKIDVWFMKRALEHVEKNHIEISDAQLTADAINNTLGMYEQIKQSIESIYTEYDLVYDGVSNPFL